MKYGKKDLCIGSDHAGFDLKEKVKTYLLKKGFRVRDLGTYSKDSCDYPDYAYVLARQVSRNATLRGILICKTGIGNSIVANKLKGVRAALSYNAEAAKLSRQHNDSNILVLGSAFVDLAKARRIIDVWLSTEFEGGRHKRRVDKIKKIEKELSRSREK